MFQTILAALFVLALGVTFFFFGYRIFLVMLPIWGFFAGFWLGAEGTALIFGTGFLVATTGWVVGFILGLVGALLSYLFYTVGVMIVAAGFGAALGTSLMAVFGIESGIFVAIAGLMGAIIISGLTLAFSLQKYVIITITSIGGVNAILLSGLLLFDKVSLQSLHAVGNPLTPILQGSWFWLIIWLILAVASIASQIRSNRTFTFTRKRYVEGWG